jgi:hypothetical protein
MLHYIGIKKAEKQTVVLGSPMQFMKFFCRTLESLACSECMQNHRDMFQRNNKFQQLHSLNSDTIIYRTDRRRTNVQLLDAALCHTPHSTWFQI